MKQIRFLFVGKTKHQSFRELEDFYIERIRHFSRCELILTKTSARKDIADIQDEETAILTRNLSPNHALIICDERGKDMSSPALAKTLQKQMEQFQTIDIIVGGPYGFKQDALPKSNLLLKLSSMTLTHEMARTLVLEQVYRAFSILSGSPYHH